MSIQDDVAAAVCDRGYYEKPNGDPWSKEQLAVRQVAKLMEELGELNRYTRQIGLHRRGWHQYSRWERMLSEAAQVARYAFDDDDWSGAWVVNEDAAAEELADIQVVVFTLADVLGIDILELAREKALDDVERGVRNGKD